MHYIDTRLLGGLTSSVWHQYCIAENNQNQGQKWIERLHAFDLLFRISAQSSKLTLGISTFFNKVLFNIFNYLLTTKIIRQSIHFLVSLWYQMRFRCSEKIKLNVDTSRNIMAILLDAMPTVGTLMATLMAPQIYGRAVCIVEHCGIETGITRSYHGCWCSGPWCRQVIKIHYIEYIWWYIFVFHEERLQIPTPSQCRDMKEITNMFFVFSHSNSRRQNRYDLRMNLIY